ncbi:hypothetical protein [Citrobacter freundii]|uniref:hypothetical protein n=1 Tax=Citrobacter freundii TaxID=546 RepID=UPI00255A85C2|nr:hypothetical protein [Citrobacter freundii]MDL4575894.1 hypothetical protein [Citrobacter freundii]
MSDRYEFMPGIFLNVALASNFFIVQVQGNFPSHVPGSLLGDSAQSALRQLHRHFNLSDEQCRGIIQYLTSRGMDA